MGHRRRAAGLLALAAVIALTVTGCGSSGGGGHQTDGKPPASSTPAAKASGTAGAGTPSATPTRILAQIKGAQDIQVTITSAVRDSGGFVTVQGTVTNNGGGPFDAGAWRGNETALSASGDSVAGAVLVDEAGKKRYYVLRDTDGRCLCTMGLLGIQPQESRPFFAQFPAPPPTTTQVEFDLPTMPPATITLSGGKG